LAVRGAGRRAATLLALALLAPVRAAEPEPEPAPAAAPQELPEVSVIGASPVPGTGIPIDRYPGNAQAISSRAIAPGTSALSGALDAAVGSVHLNDTQGNPFQVDVDFRGYTASPVLGTPQGLSVYVDGVRINEPFGDIVSWDLVPQMAIANVTVIPGTNPVYGLNTLGGALAINTKSGFAYPGTRVEASLGSFGRRTLEAEVGGSQERSDYFLAASTYDERGWTHFNPSRVRQAFAKLGYQDARTDLDASLQLVDDYLGGNQIVPQSMLDNAAQGYTHPDVTTTHELVLDLTGRRETGAGASVEGVAYLRHIGRSILNSNLNDPVTAGAPGQLAACLASYGEACAGNVLSQYGQDIAGLSLQLSQQRRGAAGQNDLSAGASVETGRTTFHQSGQDAIVDASRAILGVDAYAPQSAIGARTSTGGLYATDTWQPGARASLSASLRYDHSLVSLAGHSIDASGLAVDVGGRHAYAHANPALGATYALGPQATAFANLAQGFRAPSAIELACADAAHPCAGVPNAFSADPGLQGILARSAELGARGQAGAAAPAWSWRGAAFLSNLDHDILFNQSSLSTGYFSNVGRTRRAGLEGALGLRRPDWDADLSATWLQATYRSAFDVADPANPGAACPGPACVPVQPGDRIPGIPAWLGKLRLGWQASAQLYAELRVQAQGPSFARGDENNVAGVPRIPGYALLGVSLTQRLGEGLSLYGGISNLANRRTASYGMLAADNLRGGVAENFWALGPPRALLLGLQGAW
jgi:outer membrane receptor protein involved in Fe transport